MRKKSPFAIMKLASFIYSMVCSECGKHAELKTEKELTEFDKPTLPDGWQYNPTSMSKTVCPHCFILLKRQQAQSEDLYERIRGGLFDRTSPNFDATADFDALAIDYAGLKGHPKARKAMSLAYERGHSAGHSEVLGELMELSDLLLKDD